MSDKRLKSNTSRETVKAARLFNRRQVMRGAVAAGALVATGPAFIKNALSASGEVNRALRHLEAALESEGGDLDIRRELVKLYEKSGHKNQAAREHKKLAFALTEMGDLDGALHAYERACQLCRLVTLLQVVVESE